MLRALVEAGLDGNVAEGFSRRTALHLAVNSSGDGADQGGDSIDILGHPQTLPESCLVLKDMSKFLVPSTEIVLKNVTNPTLNLNVYCIAPQSLDLEIALLRNGADVFAADVRGRLPLHYCFVKIGAHADRSRSDPIEICSMIVEAMGGKGRFIKDVRTDWERWG